MIETVVSPLTARLAKIKGFDYDCHKFYDDNNHLRSCSEEYAICNNKLTENIPFSYNANGMDKFIMTAPSLYHLQKWIREKHKIDIIITPNQPLTYICNIYDYSDTVVDITTLKEDRKPIIFKSYESALETGIQEALKLIKK